MKVDILIAVAEKGGVENVINDTVPYFQKKGMDIRVVQLVWEGKEWVSQGVPFFHLIDGRKGNTLKKFIDAYHSFILDTYVPDLILATAWPMTCEIARRAVDNTGFIPSIFSWMHNGPIEIYEKSGFGGVAQLRYADAHIAISDLIYDDICDKLDNPTVFRINNPVDLHKFCYDIQDKQFDKKICYVGRVNHIKRLDLIIEAMAKLDREWELEIIGSDDDGYADYIKDMAKKLLVEDRIVWWGWQSEPWKIAAKNDVIVMASDVEGFPLVAIEALANGLPVISTPASGMEELIQPGINGYLYNFNDVDGLVGILNDISNGKLALPDKKACIESVEKYDRENAVADFYRKLMSVYNKINVTSIEYAEKRRKELRDWDEKYFAHEVKCIKRIDELISEGTKASYTRICDMFEGPDSDMSFVDNWKLPLDIYKQRDKISYLIQAVNIYYQECAAGAYVTVFDHGDCLGDIIDVMNQLRFIVWEIQFKDNDEMLNAFIEHYNISQQMWTYIVNSTAVMKNSKQEKIIRTCANQDETRHSGKDITFIMCVNDAVYMQEALYYINSLKVPTGCNVDVLTIEEAKSMAGGYNEGMHASKAKYKVYLQQNVFILNENFIYDVLDIFENEEIGMLGMVGSPVLPENKVASYGRRVGKIYKASAYGAWEMPFDSIQDEYEEVQAIDGLLMATQYDIEWREDIFEKWDMYDASQSQEMLRAGYKIVVPYMITPWCIYDNGV